MNMLTDSQMLKARASLVTVLTILSIAPALAYVDPGTGSMLIQMALAALAGAMFYFRQFRIVAYGWFRRTVLRQEADERDSDAKRAAQDRTE